MHSFDTNFFLAHQQMRTSPIFLLCALLLCALVAAKSGDPSPPAPVTCYTGTVYLAAQQLTIMNATTEAVYSMHTNKRTVHAATLSMPESNTLVVVSQYANAPPGGDLTLERFALDSGDHIDSVPLARSNAEPKPVQLCATNYAAVLMEANATLTLYDLITGRRLATPNAPADLVRAVACSSTRMFAAVAGGNVLELDPTDALTLSRLGAFDGIVTMYVEMDAARLLLHMRIGLPLAVEAVLDVDSHTVVAMSNALPQPVNLDVSSTAQCLVTHVDAVHSQLSQTPTGVRDSACVALSTAAPDTVLSDGIFWQGSPVAQPLGADALNHGNLGSLVAAASCAAGELLLLDSDGGLVLHRPADGTYQRLPSLPGPPVRVLALGCGISVWQTAANELMARVDTVAGADLLLPPVGGMVSAAVVRSSTEVCLQLTRQLHCMDPLQPSTSLNVIVLPEASEAPSGLVVLAYGSDLYGLSMSVDAHQRSTVQLWQADDVAFNAKCVLDLERARLPPPVLGALRPLAESVLLWAPALTVELNPENCSLLASEPVAVDTDGAGPLALALGVADTEQQCMFMSHSSHNHHSGHKGSWTLTIFVLVLVCCSCCGILMLVVAPGVRRRIRERGKHQHIGWNQPHQADADLSDQLLDERPIYAYQQRSWYAGPRAQSVAHVLLCCVPPLEQRVLAWQTSQLVGSPPQSEVLYTDNSGIPLTPMNYSTSGTTQSDARSGIPVASITPADVAGEARDTSSVTPAIVAAVTSTSASSLASLHATTPTSSSLLQSDEHFSGRH